MLSIDSVLSGGDESVFMLQFKKKKRKKKKCMEYYMASLKENLL